MANILKHSSKKQNPRTLLLHAMGFVTGDPTIRISYPFVFHPGVQVTVTEPGDAKWIYMMLPVPKGSLLTEIKVAHHRSGIQSHISHIRLVEQREPVTAEVVHDDKIAESIPSISVVSSVCNVVAKKSILLKICMAFANTDDMIEFGAVEVQFIPDYEMINLPDEGDKKRKEDTLVYRFNEKHSVNGTQPTLVDLFFQTKKKKSISK
jgi:hypothetical protein